MADKSGPDFTSPDINLSNNENGEKKCKKKRMNELMTTLRNRKCRSHTWNDIFKNLRVSVGDKRPQIDMAEKLKLGNHLAALQRSFKVKGFVPVLERIDSVCSSLGLKFHQGSHNRETDRLSVFVTSDVFNVEIVLDSQGIIKDVKIYHGSELPVYCEELMKLLNDSDFEAYREHLKGIMAMYNITGDKSKRMKAFIALQALETDLNNLSKLQSTITSVPNFIHKSPLGITIPRVGGTFMKMVYFVGPYDLLDKSSKTSKPMTIEAITENNIGHSVSVCIESCPTPHKLQTMPLMTINKTHDGKSLPSFTQVNNMNSCVLNAIFKLKLHHKVPLSLSAIKAIQATTGIDFVDELTIRPFWQLLVENLGLVLTDSLSVNLPDQSHSYFLGGLNGSSDQMGALLDTIPFVHPTHVPKIIAYLRQQALFNTILGSCVRGGSQEDLGPRLTFEVMPASLQTINVTFEHPYTDAMTTAELDLSDVTCLRCRICSINLDDHNLHNKPIDICADEFATRVFQRCLSLPITLRSVFQEAYQNMELHIIPPPMSPSPSAMTAVKQLSKLFSSSIKSNAVMQQLSRTGRERRAAFLESYRVNKIASLNDSIVSDQGNSKSSSLLSNYGVLAPGLNTSRSNVNTAVGPPPPAYPQQGVETIALPIPNSKASVPPLAITSSNNRGLESNNSRDTAVISPEVVQAFESSYADPSQAQKEVIDAIEKDKRSKNPMLASLLDQERDSPEPAPQPSMLSALLDVGGSNTNNHHASNGGGTPGSVMPNNVNPTALPSSATAAMNKQKPQQHPHAVSPHSIGNFNQSPHHQQVQQPPHSLQQQQLQHHSHQLVGNPSQQTTNLQHAAIQNPNPQHVPKRPRKRKSTGDNNTGNMNNYVNPANNYNHHHAQLGAMNSSNVMLMGRSPKRLHSSEDDFGHPTNPYSFSSVSSTAENEPSQTAQQPHHHHGQQLPPHHSHHNPHLHPHHQQPHSQHHPNAPHQHLMGTNHPPIGLHNNTLSAPHHHQGGVPGGVGSNSNNQFANFHSQTRVGGANPPVSVVSSSVVMVTESNNSSVFYSTSQTSCTTTTITTQAISTSSIISPVCSSSSSLSYIKKLSEETPVFHLAGTGESIKQETKTVSSSESAVSLNVNFNSASLTAEKKFSQLAGLLNDENSSSNSNTPVSYISNSAASITLESNIKGESSKNYDVLKPVISRSDSVEDILKKEDQIALNMECETIPNLPVNPKERTLSSSMGLKGGSSNYRRSKSIENDPFEFNDGGFLDPSCSRDSFGTDQSEVSLDDFDRSIGGNNSSSINATTATSLSKVNSKMETKREKLGSFQFKEEDYNPKRERKKGFRDTSSREYTIEENKKPTLGITMKINAKDGSAKTFVKQSPIHRSESPIEYELSSTRKSKDNFSRNMLSKPGSITPDRSSDISVDSDVFVVTSDISSINKSGGGSVVGNSGGYNLASPRLITSKNKGTEHHYHHHKGSSGALVVKEKKKKSSKSGGDSKHEKKRKRQEEAKKKDQLKKQKMIYDFDLNESEHLPPTKIKIRTSDGKLQVAGDTKTYSMSPLPLKINSELRTTSPETTRATSSEIVSVKRHKSEKVKHKKDKSEKYNRSKSETQGAKLDRSDSKLYNRTPVVKIKPLENSCPAVCMTSPTETSLKVTVAQEKSLLAPVIKVSISPIVGSSQTVSSVSKSNKSPVTTSLNLMGAESSSIKNKTVSPDNGAKNKSVFNVNNVVTKIKTSTSESNKINKQVIHIGVSKSKSDLVVVSSPKIKQVSNLDTNMKLKDIIVIDGELVPSDNSVSKSKTVSDVENCVKNEALLTKSKSNSDGIIKNKSNNDGTLKSKQGLNPDSSKQKQALNAEVSSKSKALSNADVSSKTKPSTNVDGSLKNKLIVSNDNLKVKQFQSIDNSSKVNKQSLIVENSAKSKPVFNSENTKNKMPASANNTGNSNTVVNSPITTVPGKSKSSDFERKRQSISNSAISEVSIKNKAQSSLVMVVSSSASNQLKTSENVTVLSSNSNKVRSLSEKITSNNSSVDGNTVANSAGNKSRSLSEKGITGSDKFHKTKLTNHNSTASVNVFESSSSVAKAKLDKVTNETSSIQMNKIKNDKTSQAKSEKSVPIVKQEKNSQLVKTDKTVTIAKSDKQIAAVKPDKSIPQVKIDKANVADGQKKRKGLNAVIDKLKKGINETDTEPKSTQDVYDAIRHEILKAGANKSSTLPIGKIGKISKQDAVSNNLNSTGNSKNSEVVVQNAKQAALPNKTGHTSGSFRIPKSNSNRSSTISSENRIKGGNASVSSSQATTVVSSPSQSKTSSFSNPPNHVIQKGNSNAMRQNSRDSTGVDKPNKKQKIDDISEKLQSRHFLDAVPPVKPGEDGTNSDTFVDNKKGSSNSSQTQINKGDRLQNSDKHGGRPPDSNTSSKESRNWNSHHNVNAENALIRSKSPNITKTNKANHSNKTGPNSNNFRNNQIYSSGQKVQNRPKTPIDLVNKPQTPHVNNIIEPKTISSSIRDPRVGHSVSSNHDDLNIKSSRSKLKDSVVIIPSEKKLKDEPVIIPITPTKPTVIQSLISPASPSKSAIVPELQTSKPVMFYNPAEALGRKSSTAAVYNPAEALGRKPNVIASVYNPAEALVRKAQNSSSIENYQISGKSGMKKDVDISNKKPHSRISSSAPVIPTIPLEAPNTIVSESPASPVDNPGLTIRHDTPPASPVMTGGTLSDVSDNKENMAKSIPLDEGNVFKTPSSKPLLRGLSDEIYVKASSKTVASSSCSVNSDKSKIDCNIRSKPIMSPNSDPSSPEECISIDCSAATVAIDPITGKAPVTIPLERSRSRSPAERSRSPLTPRSPVQHIPLTPKSPIPSSHSPKTSVVSTIKESSPSGKLSINNKFHVAASPSSKSSVKSPLTQISSPGSGTSKGSPCHSLDEDDLMNEAIIL